MPIIDFKATMCKHCYKCVRGCEVKSIMIRDGHAYIMPNRCILCGQCLLNCPQSAKRVPSELSKVKKLIESGAPVIASLSSSYMGVLPYKKRGQVKSALKKLGFTNVCDAAEGAALATEEYVRLLEQGEMKNIITTACPSIVNLIEIHYPELIKYLAPVLIPSGIHTRMLHAEFGETAKVVVIGPCIAEKEKNRVVKPDAVLTFEDLKQWLSEEQIEIEACEEEPFEDREPGANLRYPVSGGLLTAVTATQKKPDKYRKFYVSGVKDCLDVCEAMKTGEVAGCFIEMNACHGGCVNGPSTATSVSSFKVKLDLEAMLPKEPADLSLMHEAARQVEIHRTFADRSQKERIPTEEEIREILKKTGKTTPEQELNCGACGYPTCREKAIAVFQKKAEVDMCIPYLHDRAQSLSHLVMDTSPNLIMIIDDDMRIRDSFDLASEQGIAYSFTPNELETDVHPNTVDISMVNASGQTMTVRGESLGGGKVRIVRINQVKVDFTGEYSAVIVIHLDRPGVVAHITKCLSDRGVNIAFMRLFRESKGHTAYTIVESDGRLPEGIAESLRANDHVQHVMVVQI